MIWSRKKILFTLFMFLLILTQVSSVSAQNNVLVVVSLKTIGGQELQMKQAQ